MLRLIFLAPLVCIFVFLYFLMEGHLRGIPDWRWLMASPPNEAFRPADIFIVELPPLGSFDDESYGRLLELMTFLEKEQAKSIHIATPLVISRRANVIEPIDKHLNKVPNNVSKRSASLRAAQAIVQEKERKLTKISQLSALLNQEKINIGFSPSYIQLSNESRYKTSRFSLPKLKFVDLPEKTINVSWFKPTQLKNLDLSYLRLISSRSKLSYLGHDNDLTYLLARAEDGIIPHFGLMILLSYLELDFKQVQLKQGGVTVVGDYTINLSMDGSIRAEQDLKFAATPLKAFLEGAEKQSVRNKHIVVGHQNDPDFRHALSVYHSLLNSENVYIPWWRDQGMIILAVSLLLFTVALQSLIRWSRGLIVIACVVSIGLVTQLILLFGLKIWFPLHIPLMTWTLVAGLYAIFLYREQGVSSSRTQQKEAWLDIASQQSKNDPEQAYESIKQCVDYKPAQSLAIKIANELEKSQHDDLALDLYRSLVKNNVRDDHIKEKIKSLSDTIDKTMKMEHTMSLQKGGKLPFKNIGRYNIEKVIGQGAMGTVYVGSDPKLSRQVAIKTINLESKVDSADMADAIERFHREAETAGQLRHPNIVTIYDVDQDRNMFYIAMDYVPGVNLSDMVKDHQQLPIGVAYNIVTQVAAALKHAHEHGVVHRDIKPANIMYEEDRGHVTVMDFGIALVVDNSKTRTGTILGSPFYMSPEQIKGQKVDNRTDIFSLGVTFFQLLTGELPFEGDTFATLSYNIVNTRHKSIRKLRSELPRSAVTIVNKTLEKNKSDRCTIDELMVLLKRESQKA